MTGQHDNRSSTTEHPVVTLLVSLPADGPSDATEIGRSRVDQLGSDWDVVFVKQRNPGVFASPGYLTTQSAGSVSLAQHLADAVAEARGAFVIVTDVDGIPSLDLAREVAQDLLARETAEVVYFDRRGTSSTAPLVKPAPSPERLRSVNYWGSFVAYRRSVVGSLLAQPLEAVGAELYELALRATFQGRKIENSRVQVSPLSDDLEERWYGDDALCREGTRKALEWYLAATGGGRVERVCDKGSHRTRRLVSGEPLVSIVIPTAGTSGFVRGEPRIMVLEAVRSIVERSTYRNFEFVIVIDSSVSDETISVLRELAGDRLRLVPWLQPFSFSGKMNLGVLHARGDYLILLNDDIEVITTDWIEALLSLSQRPDAATVGAMLYFEDDTIQHAGHAYYKLDVTHVGLHSERGSCGPGDAFVIEREVEGNTAACAMVRRDRFLEVGGFSPLLPGNFNDVDLCLKLSTRGYRSYWTPHAELYHYESVTRNPTVSRYEIDTTWGRWEHLLYRSDFWPTDPHVVYGRELKAI